MLKFILTFLCSLFLVSQSQAIVIKKGASLDNSKNWGQKHFPNVCRVWTEHEEGGGQSGTGMLISPTAVLTAAHVVRSGIKLGRLPLVNFASNGKDFKTSAPFRFIDTIIPHPDHQMNKEYYCEGVDLAILKFQGPIDLQPVKLYQNKVEDNTQGYIVGYGQSGTSDGAVKIEVGTRHMGTTRISKNQGQYLTYDFRILDFEPGQPPKTFEIADDMDPLQSIPVLSDSGGPFLKGTVGNLSVAGIFHGGEVFDILGVAQCKWIPIHSHIKWIEENM
jgi:hypothetical protein